MPRPGGVPSRSRSDAHMPLRGLTRPKHSRPDKTFGTSTPPLPELGEGPGGRVCLHQTEPYLQVRRTLGACATQTWTSVRGADSFICLQSAKADFVFSEAANSFAGPKPSPVLKPCQHPSFTFITTLNSPSSMAPPRSKIWSNTPWTGTCPLSRLLITA